MRPLKKEDKVRIKFMRPCGRNRYVWPIDEEYDNLPVNEILCVLECAPEPVTQYKFSLPKKEYDRVNKIMEDIA